VDWIKRERETILLLTVAELFSLLTPG